MQWVPNFERKQKIQEKRKEKKERKEMIQTTTACIVPVPELHVLLQDAHPLWVLEIRAPLGALGSSRHMCSGDAGALHLRVQVDRHREVVSDRGIGRHCVGSIQRRHGGFGRGGARDFLC
jgi:hypothetical protein